MQKIPPLNAFIFDLGKVIVDWNPGYLLHEIAPDDEQLKFLVEEVLDLEWFRAVDAGYPLSKAIAERSKIYPCRLNTSPSPRDRTRTRMPSYA